VARFLLILAAAAMAADPRPVIVCFGDSLSAGFGVDAGLSFPDFLQKRIDQRGYRYRIVNLGISGDTTSGGLARITSAIRLKPSITILELGGNDGLRGIPLTATKANLEAMTKELLAAGSQVVIAGMTLPPNYGPDYIREFERIYVQLAAKYKLPRIGFLLEGVALDRQLMQPDGIHPTAAGNEKVAAHVMKTLEPLLRKREGPPSEKAQLPRPQVGVAG
jgi:acyl-CoA thioesterase-1